MPSALDDYEDLPFAPGASPFHLKGIVYRRHVEYVEQFVTGGEKAVNQAFRRPELRAFFEQQFLASSWYDALPIVPVWQVCAKLLKQTPTEFLKTRTRHQALHDIHGVYKFLLKIASPEMVALRMPRAILQYFDFGKPDARLVRPGVVRIEYRGIPAFLSPWLSIVGDTYLKVAFEIAGARNAQIKRFNTTTDGAAHGIPLVTLVGEAQLDAARDATAGRS